MIRRPPRSTPFPTRRSSDLQHLTHDWNLCGLQCLPSGEIGKAPTCTDRKSTRLNSSHLVISYAVFCLKKKKPAPSHSPKNGSTLTHQPFVTVPRDHPASRRI